MLEPPTNFHLSFSRSGADYVLFQLIFAVQRRHLDIIENLTSVFLKRFALYSDILVPRDSAVLAIFFKLLRIVQDLRP